MRRSRSTQQSPLRNGIWIPQSRSCELHAGVREFDAPSRPNTWGLFSPMCHCHELQSVGSRRAVSRQWRTNSVIERKCGIASALSANQCSYADLWPIRRLRRLRFSGRLAEQEWSGRRILAIVPGLASIAVWSPALNAEGNSLIGTHALEQIASRAGWSVF